jgi:hypothetical protein
VTYQNGRQTDCNVIRNACEYTAMSAVGCAPMVAFEKACFGDQSGRWGGGHVGEWYDVEVGVLSDQEMSWMKATAVCGCCF